MTMGLERTLRGWREWLGSRGITQSEAGILMKVSRAPTLNRPLREESGEGSSGDKFTKKPERHGRENLGRGPNSVLVELGKNYY